MRTENLFMTNEDVEIDETASVRIEVPAEYEETAVTTDGRVIGFDEAAAGWVELGRNE